MCAGSIWSWCPRQDPWGFSAQSLPILSQGRDPPKTPLLCLVAKSPVFGRGGSFASGKGLLKEISLFHHPPEPWAELCDEVESNTHCWACSWHLWVSSRRIRHPAELLALPQATSSCSGSSCLELLPMVAGIPGPTPVQLPTTLSPPCPSGQSWWLKQ